MTSDETSEQASRFSIFEADGLKSVKCTALPLVGQTQ
jgi:hypothetical protein